MSSGTLLHVFLPALAVVVLAVALRLRGRALRDEFAWWWPGWRRLLVWMLGFALLMVAEGMLEPALGLAPVQPWGNRYGSAERLVRLGGIILVAPAAEELIFRGVLFTRLDETRLGIWGTVGVTAVLFAALHLQYGWVEMLFVLADALYFGTARGLTGTSIVPLACHVLGNTYAALERVLG